MKPGRTKGREDESNKYKRQGVTTANTTLTPAWSSKVSITAHFLTAATWDTEWPWRSRLSFVWLYSFSNYIAFVMSDMYTNSMVPFNVFYTDPAIQIFLKIVVSSRKLTYFQLTSRNRKYLKLQNTLKSNPWKSQCLVAWKLEICPTSLRSFLLLQSYGIFTFINLS